MMCSDLISLLPLLLLVVQGSDATAPAPAGMPLPLLLLVLQGSGGQRQGQGQLLVRGQRQELVQGLNALVKRLRDQELPGFPDLLGVGERRQGLGGRKQELGRRGQEFGGRRQETGGRRPERQVLPIFPPGAPLSLPGPFGSFQSEEECETAG